MQGYFSNTKWYKMMLFFPCLMILVMHLTYSYVFWKQEALNLDAQATSSQHIDALEAYNKTLEVNITTLEKEYTSIKQKDDLNNVQISDLYSRIDDYEDKIRNLEKLKNVAATPQNAGWSVINPPIKTAYLTFDDGPSATTGKILDILKSYNIKATFFVNGRENYKNTYISILNEGHILGNHTYSHNYSSIYTSVDNFMKDVDKLDTFLSQFDGYKPNLLRFPGGSNNSAYAKLGGPDVMKQIVQALNLKGYKYYDWSVSSLDAASTTMTPKETIVNSVLSGSLGKQGAIVLMHDMASKKSTIDALPEIIEGLKKQGFIFDVLH